MDTKEIKTDDYGIVPEEWMVEVPDISVSHKMDGNFDYISDYVENHLEVDSLEFREYIHLLTAFSLMSAMVDEEDLEQDMEWKKVLSELRRKLFHTDPIQSLIDEAVENSVLSWEEYERRCDLNLSLRMSLNINSILKSEIERLECSHPKFSDRCEELSLLQQQLEANLQSFNQQAYEKNVFVAETVYHDLVEEVVEYRVNPIILRAVRPDLFDDDGKITSTAMSEEDAVMIEKVVHSMSSWIDSSSYFQKQVQDMISSRVEPHKSVLKK